MKNKGKPIEDNEKIGFIGSGLKMDKDQLEKAAKMGLKMCREELDAYSPDMLKQVYRDIITSERKTRNTVNALLSLDRILWLEGRRNEVQFTMAAAALATLHVKWKMLKEAGHDV